MTHLLDVSALVALIWPSHVNHAKANSWLKGKQIAVCPITELGFIRVSTSVAFNATMADARQALQDFLTDENPSFIPCDVRALEGDVASTSGQTTDFYLGNLAAKHGMQWATLDENAKHPAADIIR